MIEFWLISLMVFSCDEVASGSTQQATPSPQVQTVVTPQQVSDLQAAVVAAGGKRAGLWLGVNCADIPEALQKQFQIKSGVIVQGVAEKSPASQVKLQPFDVLTSIDGQSIESVDRLVSLIQKSEGKTVRLELRRQGEPKTIEIQPAPRPQPQVAMVMVGPDGKPLCKDSAALLESLRDATDGKAYSIVVVRPGLVLPKEKIAKSALHQAKFDVNVKQVMSNSHENQDVTAVTSIERAVLNGFPSTLHIAAQGVRSIQGGTIDLEDGQINLFPHLEGQLLNVHWVQDSNGMAPGLPNPRISIRLLENDSKQYSEMGEFHIEVESTNLNHVDELRHKAREIELKLEAMHSQLRELHHQLEQLDGKQNR